MQREEGDGALGQTTSRVVRSVRADGSRVYDRVTEALALECQSPSSKRSHERNPSWTRSEFQALDAKRVPITSNKGYAEPFVDGAENHEASENECDHTLLGAGAAVERWRDGNEAAEQ